MVEVVEKALNLYGQTIKSFVELMKENNYIPYILESEQLILFDLNMKIPNDNLFFKPIKE